MAIRFSMVSILVAALAWAGPALAEAEQSQETVASTSVYQLPTVGKPTGRLGGGRRGDTVNAPEVYALVPDHVGYTALQQPSLYWFLADGATGELKFELTLIDETSVDPLIDSGFAVPAKSGVQRIDLGEHGVELAAGEEYQWSIALVTDANDRSKDIVSSGWIERVPESSDLAARVSQAGPTGAAAVYGAEGLWYDSLAAAFEQLQRSPADSDTQQQIAGLLKGVGLPEDAARP